jgi:hypothetical protein
MRRELTNRVSTQTDRGAVELSTLRFQTPATGTTIYTVPKAWRTTFPLAKTSDSRSCWSIFCHDSILRR